MNQQKKNYDLLLEKLDRFIRKFYVNNIIRGALFFTAAVLIVFLVFSFLESQYYFSTAVRKFFYYGFIAFSLASFYFWIGRPGLKYFSLGKTISHEQAASIIGAHFSNIQDKLLNILHLQKQMDENEARELIVAGIEQKSERINVVPFRKAIDFSKNKRHLKYALPPLFLLLLIWIVSPGMITDSTTRIINNNKVYEKAAPFSFVIKNDKLEVPQYEDFNLSIETQGEAIPDEVFIRINQYQYRMKKDAVDGFSYEFKNLFSNTNFELWAGTVNSEEYTIEVLPKPSLDQLIVELDYPNYIDRKNETVRDNGDLLIPVGTKAKWKLKSNHTDAIYFSFMEAQEKHKAKRNGDDQYHFSRRLLKNGAYKIFISNELLESSDSINYFINIIPDKYPTIDVEEFRDSTEERYLYYAGNASDDYGLSSLIFNYNIVDNNGQVRKTYQELLTQNTGLGHSLEYDHAIDLDTFPLNPGESLNYFFEVFDNDRINGAKSSRTGLMQYHKATLKEFEEQEDENEEDIKKNLEDSIDEIKKIKENIKKNREKLLQKKELEWQDKKELEKLLEQQKELEKMIEEAKKKFDENLKSQEQFKSPEEQILEKQKQLQKMFDEVLSEETKELMQKIEDLMQELQKDDMLEMMEEFEMDSETMEKEMDRLMELFKQLELEKELSEQVEKLNELAEKQEKLSEETKEGKKENEALKKEQKEINEEFEDLEKKMDELMEKNEKLERPKDLAKDNEEKMDDISEDLEKSEESLEKKESEKASESQKSAAQKMKSMASSLDMQMQSGQEEQKSEDLKALRQLLENLLTLSFEQEDLIEDISSVDPLTPRYKELVTKQFDLKEDFRMIEDSLQALSKRVIEIESFVTEKVVEIKTEMDKALKNLEGLETNNNISSLVAQNVGEANKNQRTTMKNINDLALMLDESMQQMQQNMSGGAGSGSCDKPGGKGAGKKGNEPSDKISQGQKSLNSQLKRMQKGMQQGKGGNSAKDFAQAAARQAAMRKALEQMKKELQEEGKGAGNELQKIIDEMNKTEIDLVNKKLDNEMIRRQNDILSKLLEAEKADRQRKFDNKRKSTTANQKERKLPPALEEYLKKRESELDLYKTVSPTLNPFYKKLVDEYYNTLKKSS